ncbi:MAG: hypothetical protein M1831_000143 [Alyxoria varia]|nr:MAG: hypothetical protein M1831_000143 [Alyxoria varia]
MLSLDTQSRAFSEPASKRSSFHTALGASFAGRSPVIPEHEQVAPSGLHRIRQPPTPRISTLTSEIQSTTIRSPSMTLSPTSPSPSDAQTPLEPTASVEPTTSGVAIPGEDVTRFTCESLHSFSFTNRSDEILHIRHGTLKRTLEFLRNASGHDANKLGLASAQAKVNGDPEMQGMVDLLKKTNVLGPSSTLDEPGPVTGPVKLNNENPFEKSFSEKRSDAPDSDATNATKESNIEDKPTQEVTTPTQDGYDVTLQPPSAGPLGQDGSQDKRFVPDSAPPSRRSTLKRTFTDVGPLSVQSQLMDALAQPFLSQESQPLSPLVPTTSATSAGSGGAASSGIATTGSHAHGRGAPNSQAIFMTECHDPWKITAANDLACLYFGYSKTELRNTSILDVFREDKRRWLESKLKTPEPSPGHSPRTAVSPRRVASPLNTSNMGNGITAQLLRKPPSRETSRPRRSQSYNEMEMSNPKENRKTSLDTATESPSRNVILCGEVLPILKRDGSVGAATLWVQEKRRALIWVLEEIAQDTAVLTLDEVGCVVKATGQIEAVWGMERVRRGMDVTRILPGIPRIKGTNTGALDFDRIAELKTFTARTANDINVPVSVEQMSGESTFRVSSFPHIAGMMVLSASSLKVSSSNQAAAEALFGQSPNGLPATDFIPGFDKMLELLVEENDVELVAGIVIPEHSFRRARAMLALKEGKEDGAQVFLRPSGLPAVHRDGSEIMIDVQMRVLKSESLRSPSNSDSIIEEKQEVDTGALTTYPEVVYALWVTYSRMLHAANHGVGPLTPLVSRPGTPPNQPTPNDTLASAVDDSESSSDEGVTMHRRTRSRSSSSASLERVSSRYSKTEKTGSTTSAAADTDSRRNRSINDFVILEDMGAGAYGQVKLARPRAGGASAKRVVIKYVTKRRILVDTWTRDRRLGTVPLEIHVLDYLRRDGFRHPNIVEMIGFFEDDVNYYIEMVPHGLPGMDLFDYIELRAFGMPEEECRKIFVQVASAIEFLHTKAKVVHRDIKDENVVLDGEGRVKLIDFGSANYIRNGPFEVFVGTIDYAAPEILTPPSPSPSTSSSNPTHAYAGPAQDIWALGILLYTILYKENPFYSIDEIIDRDLRIPEPPPLGNGPIVSAEAIALVRRMLDRDVERRVGIGEVLGDGWCRGDVGESA